MLFMQRWGLEIGKLPNADSHNNHYKLIPNGRVYMKKDMPSLIQAMSLSHVYYLNLAQPSKNRHILNFIRIVCARFRY